MFDVSFSELLLIGVIALVVIGPERLPKVARTIGHLVGRAQRYVNEVKTDIQREIAVDEFSSLKGQMEDAANTVKASINDATNSLRKPVEEAQEALKDAADSVNSAVKPKSPDGKSDPAAQLAAGSVAESIYQPLSEPLAEPPLEPASPHDESPAAPALAAGNQPSAADDETLPLPGFEPPPASPKTAAKPTTGTPT
jgi:sec-independent protein translocase protein TatB